MGPSRGVHLHKARRAEFIERYYCRDRGRSAGSNLFRYGLPNVIISDNGVQFRAKRSAIPSKAPGRDQPFVGNQTHLYLGLSSPDECKCRTDVRHCEKHDCTVLKPYQARVNQISGCDLGVINVIYQSSNKWSGARRSWCSAGISGFPLRRCCQKSPLHNRPRWAIW